MRVTDLVLILSLGALAACSPPASSGAGPSQAGSEPKARHWEYRQIDDPMSSKKGDIACVESKNEVQLDFPYKPVTASLCIRRMPRDGLSIYVHLNGDGQILCPSYDGCSVLVRHDDGDARKVSAAGAADNSSNIVFFNGENSLLQRLRDSNTTRVELSLYQAGQQIVEFDTSGLEWPPKVKEPLGTN
jgi:hypothetical protein